MGSRIAYFGTVKLGTELLSIDPLHQRAGAAVIAGIDQARAKIETRSPNFVWTWRVWAQEVPSSPANRSVEQCAKDLLEEMKGLEDLSDDNLLRSLVWIEDDAKTTTVSGAESAGSNVVVEVASVVTLGVVAGDYVLILGSSFSEVCLVSSKTTGPPQSITVASLANNLSGGETIYLVTIHYPNCRYDSQDPGRAEDRSGNRIRPRKTYVFQGQDQPLWRT